MSASTQVASERVVVLLRPAEKRQLEKLARAQKVSAGEILRRSLDAYGDWTEADKRLLGDMNAALDNMLASVREARHSVQDALKKTKVRVTR